MRRSSRPGPWSTRRTPSPSAQIPRFYVREPSCGFPTHSPRPAPPPPRTGNSHDRRTSRHATHHISRHTYCHCDARPDKAAPPPRREGSCSYAPHAPRAEPPGTVRATTARPQGRRPQPSGQDRHPRTQVGRRTHAVGPPALPDPDQTPEAEQAEKHSSRPQGNRAADDGKRTAPGSAAPCRLHRHGGGRGSQRAPARGPPGEVDHSRYVRSAGSPRGPGYAPLGERARPRPPQGALRPRPDHSVGQLRGRRPAR